MDFYKRLAKKIPGLQTKLYQAAIYDAPEFYVKKIALTAFMLSASFSFVVFAFFPKLFLLFLITAALTPLVFSYMIKYVDVKIEQLRRKIDEEIVFAGRFLIIELHSGVPMHKAFENIEQNYPVVGSFFGDVVNKIYLGTSIEDAINEVLLNSPSPTLRRILWQLLNSLKTGSDVAPALSSVIDQIVKEQEIAVKEYGKKLNPLAMFYMMVAVIVPSLGTTMLVVMATFMGFTLSLTALLALAGFIGFVQLMFLSMIRSSRPPISMQ